MEKLLEGYLHFLWQGDHTANATEKDDADKEQGHTPEDWMNQL